MKLVRTMVVACFPAAALMIGFVGCSPSTTDPLTTDPSITNPSAAVTTELHDEHAHPSEGPHHGNLIELGNEEYHAEMIHDEATNTVTIYTLNANATEQIPIHATEITINATHEGTPKQFKLAASPDSADPQGKSSRFVSTDAELGAHLDQEGTEPTLVVTIDGKSFRGRISHGHSSKH